MAVSMLDCQCPAVESVPGRVKSARYGLARYLEVHAIAKADERGWGRLENGVLLSTAKEAGFEVFFTADKNLRYQQNLSGRKIALVVPGNSPWHLVRLHIPEIVAAINVGLNYRALVKNTQFYIRTLLLRRLSKRSLSDRDRKPFSRDLHHISSQP